MLSIIADILNTLDRVMNYWSDILELSPVNPLNKEAQLSKIKIEGNFEIYKFTIKFYSNR